MSGTMQRCKVLSVDLLVRTFGGCSSYHLVEFTVTLPGSRDALVELVFLDRTATYCNTHSSLYKNKFHAKYTPATCFDPTPNGLPVQQIFQQVQHNALIDENLFLRTYFSTDHIKVPDKKRRRQKLLVKNKCLLVQCN
jgi:hypothetical protein